MLEQTTTRHNPLIDPTLHIWHGEVAVYLFLGGIVGGLMILIGLYRMARSGQPRSRALELAPWLAPILLTLGGFALWLDLANRWNVYQFFATLQLASPMSWGGWILLAIYPTSMLFAWQESPDRFRETILKRLPWLRGLTSWADERRQLIALWSILLGILLAIYTGILLGTVASRPLWNSPLLGPLFLSSGISSAAALLLLLRLTDKERRLTGQVDMVVIGVELGLLGLWLLGLGVGGQSSQAAGMMLWGGPFTAAFWTLVVGLGLAAPLVAEVIEYRHKLVPGRAAAIMVLVGGFTLRWIIVFAGQATGWVSELAQF
jgi:protein NrfD